MEIETVNMLSKICIFLSQWLPPHLPRGLEGLTVDVYFPVFSRAETLETVFPSSVFNDLNRRNHPKYDVSFVN